LLEQRLRYLERFTSPLTYENRVPLERMVSQYIPPIDAQLALQSFYVYVKESGLLWKDHRDYLWPQWMSGEELEKFESSEWFRAQEQPHRCSNILHKLGNGGN
jgi:hypothetical protein